MICYSSEEDLAFSVFEEGILDSVASRFAKIINDKRVKNNF